jgi:hypothetical protein
LFDFVDADGRYGLLLVNTCLSLIMKVMFIGDPPGVAEIHVRSHHKTVCVKTCALTRANDALHETKMLERFKNNENTATYQGSMYHIILYCWWKFREYRA